MGIEMGQDVSSARPLKFRRRARPLAGTSRRRRGATSASATLEGGPTPARGNGQAGSGSSGEAGGELIVSMRGLPSCPFPFSFVFSASAGLQELPEWDVLGDAEEDADTGGKLISNGSHPRCSSAAMASRASFEMSSTPSRMMGWSAGAGRGRGRGCATPRPRDRGKSFLTMVSMKGGVRVLVQEMSYMKADV
ncbi:hypothetical protein DFH06DRAFT_1175819 [Mycena polygramma]|nr:hypothetical protein DFH06DRAFT_1175819 [Mycena polygramma]